MKTITTSFAMLLATAAVVPLLMYGGVSVYSLRVGTRSSVLNGNINVAKRAAEQIELYLSTNIKILETLAADLENTRLEQWQQDRILKNYVLQFPEFRELTLLDVSGSPIASSRVGPAHLTSPPAGTPLIGRLSISSITVDDDLLPTATLGIRLDRMGQPAGWLAGEINLEEMWRMVDRIRVGSQGYALVVVPGGRLIANGDPDQKPRVARGDNLLDHPLMRALGASPRPGPVSAEYTLPGGRAVLGVAARLSAFDWTVIVEQPVAEAYAVTSKLERQLLAAIGLALLVTVAVGYHRGRQFIQPIFALMRGTGALAEGRLEERVRIGGEDEFHQLGEAFNSMAGRLVELQDAVRKQERQAMFGRIAAGLVHDLAHPVQNIGNSCKLIFRMWDDEAYRETFKRTIEREFATLKRVLDDLRNVAKPMPLERFPIDINAPLADVVEAMRPAADAGSVSLESTLVPEAVYIDGDPFALGRVYRNLILNAIQATPPGGRVRVSTVRMGDRAEVAEVQVSDTGCGIQPERLAGIFEDFVTTKRSGLGLGLAISAKIVEQLGGTITVTSEVDRGTLFVLRFPASEKRPAEAAVAG